MVTCNMKKKWNICLVFLFTFLIMHLLPAGSPPGLPVFPHSANAIPPAPRNILVKSPILIKSPDGRLSFQLSPGNKDLLFTILSGNIPVISPSPLRFSLDGKPVTDNSRLSGIRRYTIREKYPWLGVHATAVNECNGAELHMMGEGIA